MMERHHPHPSSRAAISVDDGVLSDATLQKQQRRRRGLLGEAEHQQA